MRFLIGILIGMTIQPYALSLFEWWLLRPKKARQEGYFEHCGGCVL